MALPRTVTGSLLLVTALTLAGCASGGAASTASTPSGAPAPAATTTTPGSAGAAGASGPVTRSATASSTSPTSKAGLKPRSCGGADLRVAAGRSDGGMGHIGVVLLFHNVASTGCQLRGYPGVAGLDAAGRQVAQAGRTTSGYLGGLGSGTTPPTVTLTSGGTASALVEATDVPSGTATSCPSYAALLVTPPNTTAATHLAVTMPGCSGLEVHPVVASTDGTQHG